VIVSVSEAVARLARGELVAYPTETVYALGADPFQPRALERLLEAKGRAADRGLSLLIRDAAELARIAPAAPAAAARLAARFWPGPLTLVVSVAEPAFAAVATQFGVGFRCSPQPSAAAFARAAPVPIVSTSCNKSGEPPCRSAAEVEACFGRELAILGGEPAAGLQPSTVVAVRADGSLELLRAGELDFAEVTRVAAGA
jgi:tRNA threonylcarbamoyl adenosine modification protein (Sua5/YciO/YrdC/YwlC family)